MMKYKQWKIVPTESGASGLHVLLPAALDLKSGIS